MSSGQHTGRGKMSSGQATYERNVSKGMDRCAAMYLWNESDARKMKARKRKVKQVAERLRKLIPELECGRKTHLDWGAYFERYPAAMAQQPDLGDVSFHKENVAVYNERIAAIQEAIEALKEGYTPEGEE